MKSAKTVQLYCPQCRKTVTLPRDPRAARCPACGRSLVHQGAFSNFPGQVLAALAGVLKGLFR